MSASIVLQIPSTPTSVTLRTQPANITVRQESAETILVGVAGPAGPTGAGGALGYYGAFASYQTQTAPAANAERVMYYDTIEEANGISINTGTSGYPSRITFTNAGTYNVQFSAQFQNTNTNEKDAQIWLRKEEVDVVGSNGLVYVPGSHGVVDGHIVAGWNFMFTVAANDYYEFVWRSDSTNVSIKTYSSSAGVPSTASIVLTVQQVMNTQVGPTGATGPGVATGGLRGQSLVKLSGTNNDTGWVYPSDLSQPAALRRWARSFGGVRQGKLFGGDYRRTTNVIWVGDSIAEGSSSVEDSSTMVNIFTDNVSEYTNFNGLAGRWVPANLDWRPSPRWQAETIGSQGTSVTQGISLRGMTLAAIAGAQKGQSMLLTWTGDNLLIHYRKRKMASSGSIRFSLLNQDGSGNWQVLRTFPVIDTVETDAAVPTDGHKLYAFNVASEYFNATFQVLPRADYRIVVSQWSPTSAGTGGSVQFDGAYICDGNTQQGIRVWNASLSGSEFASFNNTVDATLNDDWLSALRNALIDPSLVVIALGTNEQATTNNWINGPSNASAIETKLRQMVTDITAAYAVGYPTSAAPSIALFVPPASYLDGSADWQLVRNMYQRVASELNLAIWDWAEFTGDVNFEYAFVGQLNATINASTNPVTISTPLNVTAGSTIIIDSEQMIVGSVAGSTLNISTRGANGTTAASHSTNAYIYNLGIVAGTGDPQDWTSGDSNNTHPNTIGHRTIGDFATSQAMSAVNAPRNMTPTISVGDIPALSVGTSQLIDGAVTTDKIGLSAVTGSKIATETITATNIIPGTITSTQVSEAADILPASILGTAVITTDSRLSDSRTPNPHASTHASGGSDPLTATNIGAIPLRWKAGTYVRTPMGTTAVGTVGLNKDRSYCTGLYVPRGGGIDRVGIEVTVVGGAGSVTRIGLYADNDGVPGSLLFDAGTIDTATATGFIQATVNWTNLNDGLYWVATVSQVGTGPTLRSVSTPLGGFAPYRPTGISNNPDSWGVYGQVMTGALAATFTLTAQIGAPLILIRAQ